MKKCAYFYVDDVIWVFRDLTRERPASLFDQRLLRVLKEAYEKYGMKTQLNAFYRTDAFYGNDVFTLEEMTDAYRQEWEEAAHWLKIGFHARGEFPDYPYVNADYEQVFQDFQDMYREVCRFAGEQSFCMAMNPHWTPVSKAGVQALYDCGVRVMSMTLGKRYEYAGDSAVLPYGHAARLLHNRKPETMLFRRGTLNKAIDSSICGYNHLEGEQEEALKHTLMSVRDPESGMRFTKLCGGPTLNLSRLEDLEGEFGTYLGNEFIGFATHEQYSYPDYYAYQPDHGDKILKAAEIMHKNGYNYIWDDEM